MRAPAAPRVLQRARPSPRPRAPTPRSRRAGWRARRRAAAPARSQVAGGERARPSRRRARSRSRTWRTRRSSGSGSAASARGRVAQAVDAERLAGRAALRAALVVAAGGVLVGGAGVERHELPVAEVERHGLDRQRAEVDPQRVALLARRGRRAGRAGRSRAPTQSFSTREHSFASSTRSPGSSSSARHSAALQRGGGGQPGAVREVALDREPARADLVAGGAQLGDRAAHERAPAARARPAPSSANSSRSPRSAARASIRSPRAAARRDRHAAVDRERQREAVVVVGVLADQVHAAGAAGDDAAQAISRAPHHADRVGALVDQQVAAAGGGGDRAERAASRRTGPGTRSPGREEACTKRRTSPSGFCVG